jgi:tetratricopeptide (TPR) repeat protein
LGTPNACSDCHKDRSSQWAAEAVASWYGPKRASASARLSVHAEGSVEPNSGWHYADAIDAGRRGRAEAEKLLARTVTDTNMPAIVRATALSLLSRYLSPASLPAVAASLRDSDPLVRRAALEALVAVDSQTRAALGLPLLHDPIRSVRLEAVSLLVSVPADIFSAEQLAALETGIAEYREVQACNADRAESYLNLGALDARLGNFKDAEAAYRVAIEKQPAFIPAYINLADLYREQGWEEGVELTLREALKVDPNNGDVQYALGLSLVRRKRLHDAIPALAKAAQQRPDLPRYAYAYAVALHEAGNVTAALQALAKAHERHAADRDILVALAEYSREAGDHKAAAAWARKLEETLPGDETSRHLLQSLKQRP